MTASYRAILFDADGTLIDSVEAHVLSFRELAEEVGLGPVDVRKYIGLSFRNIIRNAFGEKWLDKLDELRERRKDIFLRKYFEKVTPLIPLSTLRELRKRYKLGVVTSGGALTLSLLKKFGYTELMDVIITPRGRSKSCPDPILRAVEVVGRPTLYVGDTVYDEAAALAAGVDFMAVEDFIAGWRTLIV